MRSLSKVGQRALDDNSPAEQGSRSGLSRRRFAAASHAPTAQNQKHGLLRFPAIVGMRRRRSEAGAGASQRAPQWPRSHKASLGAHSPGFFDSQKFTFTSPWP